MQDEFAPFKAQTNALLAHTAVLLGFVVLHVEQVVAVFARLLGVVHGLVGVPDEHVCIRTVLRVERDTDAG